MKLFKNIISAFACGCLLFFSSAVSVDAATGISWLEPAGGVEAGNDVSETDLDTINDALIRLFDRCGLNYSDYYIILNGYRPPTGNESIYLYGLYIYDYFGNNWVEQYKSYNSVYYNIFTCDRYWGYSGSINSLDNINSINFSSNTQFYKQAIMYNSNTGYCSGELRDYGSGSIQSGSYPPPSSNFVYYSSLVRPFDPVIEPILKTPYNLNIQKEGFIEWLINNDRYREINSAILENHVGGWVDVFTNYGGNQSFFKKIALQFINANRINMGADDINVALTKTKSLYQEYLKAKNDIYGNHLSRRTWDTNNIIPETNDTNNTLVINDANDTVDISILRDILRACINIPNVINDNFNILFNKLDNMDNVVNIVNDSGIDDFSVLYIYDADAFSNDLQNFEEAIEEVQSVPQGYIDTINQNSLMPENMLEDKNSLTVNVPTITGFTVGGNGSTYSTQTGSYVLRSVDYPWLDTAVQKIKRFASIILILGYLVHLRYRIPDLIRGE